MALCLMTMFVGYFRPGEIISLESNNVVPAHGAYRHTAVNLFPSRLEDRSKTGLADISILMDAPYAPVVGEALAALARMRPHLPLFEFDYLELKREFMKCQELLLLPERFILYQIRHGGPSHDRAFQVRDLAAVKQRGQWCSDASVKRYESHARLQAVEQRLSVQQLRLARGAYDRLAPALLRSLTPTEGGAFGPRAQTLPLVAAGGPGGAASSSSLAVVTSRRRLRMKAPPARLGTTTTTPATTCSPQTSCSTLSTSCVPGSSSTSTSAYLVKAGLGRAGTIRMVRRR